MIRWLTTNLRTFLLAFALGIAVWVTAVTAADPDETLAYPNPIPIEFIGQDTGLVMTGSVPEQVEVTLRAPRSVWESLLADSSSVRAVADLTGLDAGEHQVHLQVQIGISPVKIIAVTPAILNIALEPLTTRQFPVTVVLSGLPATGYLVGETAADPQQVALSGPESIVSQVQQVQAVLELDGDRQNISASVLLQAVDADGNPVRGVTIYPDTAQIEVPLLQQGGYRDLAVKVVTVGGLASGYRLKTVNVSPLVVTVYSGDTALVNSLPGYVETIPLNLSGASENIQVELALNLPSNVTVVGEQTVLVQIEIVPMESSLTIAYRPILIVGLPSNLRASLSPQTVDVILSGPLSVLNSLTPSNVNVQLDLTGLTAGTYQLTPVVTVSKQGIAVESILPGTVEVIISAAPTPTP
jgi:YbbR domain-containing protein